MGRKVYIVFEEGEQKPEGRDFRVYMDGMTDAEKAMPEAHLGTAPFWCLKCFQIVMGIINKTGALKSVTPMPKGN